MSTSIELVAIVLLTGLLVVVGNHIGAAIEDALDLDDGEGSQ
jgi:hypothetical protein